MATFKVGQRVKKVRAAPGFGVAPLGSIGTITGIDPEGHYEWTLLYDGLTPPGPFTSFYADSFMLAPLTDPRADEFVERIKKLKVYDEPLVVKTKERA